MLCYTLDPSENVEIAIVKVAWEGDSTLLVREAENLGLEFFQAIPATLIVTPRHLAISAYFAYRAFKRKMNISKRGSIEILLYLMGTRQISNAISKVLKFSKDKRFYLVLVGVNASKSLGEFVGKYGLEIESITLEPIVECELCKDVQGELSSYKGSLGERLEKACISKSALLNALL